jgi:uncharacterized protein YndB with AHSA1/START domain
MAELAFEADIHCPAERIFELIVDLRGHQQWLGNSPAYRGTAEISTNPARLGTTYTEPSPFGVRHGTVTEFQPPTRVTFHQPMTMRLGAGTVDIAMTYALIPQGSDTTVRRELRLHMPWPLKLIQPIFLRALAIENRRTLRALKACAES